MNGRKYIKGVVIGYNQTGKTYYIMNEVAKKLLQADPSKKVILVSSNFFDDTTKNVKKAKSFRDLKRLKSGFVQFWDTDFAFEKGDEELFKEMYLLAKTGKINNGAIIIDDAIKFFPNGKISKTMSAFLTDYRHFGLDFFFIFHGIHDVPPKLWRLIDFAAMKKTKEYGLPYKYFFNERKIPNAQAFYKAYKILEKISFKSEKKYTTIHVNTGV